MSLESQRLHSRGLRSERLPWHPGFHSGARLPSAIFVFAFTHSSRIVV